MNKSKKTQLGQFYTTNYQYILTGLEIPKDINKVIEPFVGHGDLINFVHEQGFNGTILHYDIDPQIDHTIQQDTLLNPPLYKKSFVITNPPFLSRNKSSNKLYYNKYKINDLYKCFIQTLINDPPDGGILIIPINFFSSSRKLDYVLRDNFLSKFKIIKLNIFEEQVFDDTSSTICSFQFRALCSNMTEQNIRIEIFPNKNIYHFLITKSTNWLIGSEIYLLPTNPDIKISRLIEGQPLTPDVTNIKLIGIDDGKNNGSHIRLQIDNNLYYGKTSSRTYATLVISPPLHTNQQIKLVSKFNAFLESKRLQYHSLFLSNYRESKDYSRKRISFRLVYQIVNYLIDKN